jgi:tetratricopeptide (TPR) repeat protein
LEKNHEKAIEWFKKIPEPDKYLRDGGRYGDGGYYVSEGENYRRQAQRQLGICHALGNGVEQNYAEAKNYFEKAARTSSLHTSNIQPMVDPRAEAELGICLYRLGEVDEARKCFERSSNEDDILGSLWLCYLNSAANKEKRDSIEYVPPPFGLSNPFHKPSKDEKLSREIDETELKIDSRLRAVAVYCEQLEREGRSLDLDMLDASAGANTDIISFLENRPQNPATHPTRIILAFYYKSIREEEKFLQYLKEASKDCNDVIANLRLGLKYGQDAQELFEQFVEELKELDDQEKENIDREKVKNAETFLSKVVNSKNNDSGGYSSEAKYVSLAKDKLSVIRLIEKDVELKKSNAELKKSNEKVTAVNSRMQKLVAEFTHTLGNVIFPDTIYHVAERLKNNPEYRKDVLLLNEAYHSEIIIKLQSELLQKRYTNDNPENLRWLVRSCRRSPDSENGEKIKSIDAILDYAASRVAARFLNQYNASLNSIRCQILSLKKTNLDALKQKFEDDILLNQSLSAIEWINQNLRPFKVKVISPLWQKVRILAESHAEALVVGYFSEVLFNAFKYADHAADSFLVVELDQCIVDNKTYLTASFCNPRGNETSTRLGSGKGLDAIREDLQQLNDTGNDTNSLMVTTNEQTFQVTLFFQKDLLLVGEPIIKVKF